MGKENYTAGIGGRGSAPVKSATLVFFEKFNGVKDQGEKIEGEKGRCGEAGKQGSGIEKLIADSSRQD
jgi:hypothetical protein